MKYLVAVSGGVDSVVLLDMLVQEGRHEIIVAHFDHGIRSDSAADARFVRALANYYSLPFVTKREELGNRASEEFARNRRYEFLRSEARKYEATIVTAHHADDIIETIAINFIRGTGWRGVAVFNSTEIIRPLLHLTKKEIYKYALAKKLEWVEDSTNAETNYLRNRIRRRLARYFSDTQNKSLLEIWHKQSELTSEIEAEVSKLVDSEKAYSRYFLTYIHPNVATELLRAIIMKQTRQSPMRPQLVRTLLAVKTAKPGTFYEVGDRVRLRFTTQSFFVETP